MADLQSIRTTVIKQTGRFDLVTDAPGGDFSNKVDASSLGINYYINKAQRKLDRLLQHPQSKAWYDYDTSAGDYSLTMTDVRAIESVWYANATTRLEIGKKRLQELMGLYKTPAASQTNASAPSHWAVGNFNRAPARIGAALPTYGFEEMISGDPTTKHGIVWYPPSDGTYTILVLGYFYSESLSADTDVSFWTAQHEEVLIAATRWLLENSHKNQEGMNDFEAAFRPEVEQIDKDVVEEQVALIGQLDG